MTACPSPRCSQWFWRAARQASTRSTADRAKPAVPFGGHYRLIDFALSNLANGGYLRIVVLTQYKSTASTSTSAARGAFRRCSTPTSRRCRPNAAGPTVVRGLGRRASSRTSTWSRRPSRLHREVAPTTFTGWTLARWWISTRPPGRGHGRRNRVPKSSRPFGVIEAGPGTTIDAFREKPKDAEGIPAP